MKKFLKKYFGGDPVIWFVFLAMCVWSVIAFFSASSKLIFDKDKLDINAVTTHIGYMLMGLAAALVIINSVPVKVIRPLAYVGLLASFVLLIFVLFKGEATNEAKRWIQLGPVRFQPSELAKLSLVIVAADMLSRIKDHEHDEKKIFWWLIGISGVICALIFVENFSTAALLFFVIILLCFVQKISWKRIGIIVLSVLVVISIIFIAAWNIPKLPSVLDRASTWVSRLKGNENNPHGKDVVINKNYIDASGDTLRYKSYQYVYDIKSNSDTVLYEMYSGEIIFKHKTVKAKNGKDSLIFRYPRTITNQQEMNSKIAIARGMPGKFPGNSIQRKYLTYAYADYIYAIIIEDTGFLGGIGVILLYLVLLFRAGRITARSKNDFLSMLVVGLSSLIVIQALIHMFVVTGISPVTGQPLPLFSRGGTSAIITCIYFGIILSVTKQMKKEEQLQNENNAQTENENTNE
ncbi:MAG: FtsW/RodA/SpoVE family cell cycle protein [Paludibacter sp.]|nr:FtsW/RodA/SpoVE family cell cycle protein [Paludibacter sp.]